MKKLSEDEMILHFYGEADDPAAIERALAADPALRAEFEKLKRELEALPQLETPEPAADLAARVWREIRPQIAPRRASIAWPRLRGDWRRAFAALTVRPGFALAAGLALVAAVGIGFLLGRGNRTPTAVEAASPALSVQARERLLLASVSEHLGGSERLFAGIANASNDDRTALVEQSRWAASLAASNRLYRRAAERSGQRRNRRIIALLDELEPLLLELANVGAESSTSVDELAAAKRRIDDNDLLFKLRVAGERLQPSPGAARSARASATS